MLNNKANLSFILGFLILILDCSESKNKQQDQEQGDIIASRSTNDSDIQVKIPKNDDFLDNSKSSATSCEVRAAELRFGVKQCETDSDCQVTGCFLGSCSDLINQKYNQVSILGTLKEFKGLGCKDPCLVAGCQYLKPRFSVSCINYLCQYLTD